MEVCLYENDLVVINTDDKTAVDGEVFALSYSGEPVIKRLQRNRGEWFATSDNTNKTKYPDKVCNDETTIIGRAILRQSENF